MDRSIARRLWQLAETIHAVVYFEPRVKEIYGAAGLKGYWMGYFASRSAALGPASPELVQATFYNFHPDMIGRAIPDAWRFSTPEKVLAARNEVALTALQRLLREVEPSSVEEAGRLLVTAASAADPAGRALFAAHASLPWPDDPYLSLWHACTLLREFRGDGHNACLTAAGIDGCEAHVLFTASGGVDREVLQRNRGWSDEEWAAAEQRLRARDLLADIGISEAGRTLRAMIEADTDRLTLQAWGAVEQDVDRLIDAMTPIVVAIVDGGGVPFPNPIGLPAPEGKV
ncbi:MAG: SCO6745 family protein [Actinomycetota bacterium]